MMIFMNGMINELNEIKQQWWMNKSSKPELGRTNNEKHTNKDMIEFL